LVPRALKRRGPESEASGAEVVRSVLELLELVELDHDVALQAAALAAPTLRSLDAIHLASALAIGEELSEFITYDVRLAAAARAAGPGGTGAIPMSGR
jgi:predicted nucleic acid-binding protein